MPAVNCPSCARELEVEAAYLDWTVRCPHCETEFVPARARAEQDPRDGRDEDDYDRRPRRRRDRWDGEDDDYYRPRRRRRPDPEREEGDHYEAMRLAHGPGVWLEVCGWVGGLLMLGFGAVRMAISAVAWNGGNPANPGPGVEEEVNAVIGAGLCLMAVPFTLVLVGGGRKLRALSGRGWAMTAAVTATASFLASCCLCVFGVWLLITTGVGIWAVVTLSNPLVNAAFRRVARGYELDWAD
ncbi:MAG: hypothetical protein K2V38_15315 [Gemmataceae bacterium]|nr:hypothetical protein [Gemmataceae bacterium]